MSPVGLAHLDHAPLWGLNRLAVGLEIARPKPLGAFKVIRNDERARGRKRGKVLSPGLAVIGASMLRCSLVV
jgi:hypothetical protein